MSGWITHKFKCPSCDEAGEIKLPISFERFNCPADCGASFIHYEERPGKWRINCVVQPVFEDETPRSSTPARSEQERGK